MKTKLLAAILVIFLGGCAKKMGPQGSTDTWDFYTVKVEKAIKDQKLPIQLALYKNLKMKFFPKKGSLFIDERGVVQKITPKEIFNIKAGQLGTIEKDEGGIYWVSFDEEDERSVPFVKNSDGYFTVLLTNAKVAKKTGTGEVKLSDGFYYHFDIDDQKLLYSYNVQTTKEKVEAQGKKVPGRE